MEAHEAPITPPDATPDPADQQPSQNGHGGPQENATAVADAPTAARNIDVMFKYSAWVHVGPGAEECEKGAEGSCANPQHFHAWCRLPNKFQQAAIREKAQAAKARTLRLLRDPESDKRAILDSELDALASLGDHGILVDEVLAKTYWKDHLDAMREIAEGEEIEDGDENPFQHIEEDQRRFQALTGMDPEDRPQEEYDELVQHLARWNAAVDKVRDEKQRPQKETLVEKSSEELLEMIRTDRIDREADDAAMRSYSMWEWCVGVLKPSKEVPTVRLWSSVEAMQQAAPEVIEAIEATFNGLESALGAAQQQALRAEGNS